MRPESTSVTFRPDLSVLSTEYMTEKAGKRFIGRRAAPIFRSGTDSAGYPIMNRENFKKPAETKRASDGSYNRIIGTFGKGTFDTEENGLEYVLDAKRVKKFARFFDAEVSATQILTFQMLLAHERRVAALYSGGGFTNHNVATAWSTVASASPLDDLKTGINALRANSGAGREDISLIIPDADFQEMLATTQVVDKSKYTLVGIQPAFLEPFQIATMLGIKEVLIASGIYDSANEGLAESNTQIWADGVMYLAVLANEDDSLDIPSAARTVLWEDDSPEMPVIETYIEDKIRAEVVRERESTDEVLQGETDLFVYKITNT